MKRVGILTSGGDCQGLNAAIRGVAKGLYFEFGSDVEIYGIKDGYKGLIFGEYTLMKESDFSGIDGADGRKSDVAGSRRIPYYGSRASAPWCCSSWCEQKKWIIRSEQSGGQALRYFLYIDAISDHRTIFCNSEMCNGCLLCRS